MLQLVFRVVLILPRASTASQPHRFCCLLRRECNGSRNTHLLFGYRLNWKKDVDFFLVVVCEVHGVAAKIFSSMSNNIYVSSTISIFSCCRLRMFALWCLKTLLKLFVDQKILFLCFPIDPEIRVEERFTHRPLFPKELLAENGFILCAQRLCSHVSWR